MQAHSKGRRWAAADKARASFYGGGNDVSGSEAVTVLPGGGCNSTPVGFEPTRGDPIGLAGRRLSRSAKVSLDGGLTGNTFETVCFSFYKFNLSPHNNVECGEGC